MPRDSCLPCCNPTELARNVDSYRDAVLQILCTIAAGSGGGGGGGGATTTLLAGNAVIGALLPNQSVNVAQIAGTATSVNNGVSDAGTQRVTLASDSTGQVKLAAGNNVIGHTIVDSLPAISLAAGTNVIGHTIVDTLPSISLGASASVIGHVIVDSAPGGGGTNSTFGAAIPATGTAAGLSDGTNMQLARVFDADTGAGTQYVEGANLRISANGGSIEAKGQQTMANSIPVTVASDQSALPVNNAQVSGTTVSVGNGVSGAGVQRVTIASDSTGQTILAAGSAVIGHVIVDSIPAVVSHVIVDSAAAITNQSVNLAQVAGNTTSVGNGVSGTGVQRTVIASDQTAFAIIAAGDTAAAATDAGNPVKIGGQARTTNPTAVTDGQRVNATFDKLGKQVVVPAIRILKGVQQTTITSSTAETTIITADATQFCDLYGLVITNTSATVCKVTIKDATAGTTRMSFEIPATDTRGFTVDAGSAVPQAAVNNNWTATCGTSVAGIEITAMYVKNL